MGVRGKKGGGSPAACAAGEPRIVPLTLVLGVRANGQGGRFEIRRHHSSGKS
jgi:hypothetical protein